MSIPMPGSDLNMRDATAVCHLFDQAAEASLDSAVRDGGIALLPPVGCVIMTGDLHDNGLNFRRILKLAKLHKLTENHLVLHEIIHGSHFVNGADMSIRTLIQVAALKLEFPNRVHLMHANHELAQLGGEGILKDGVSIVEAFDDGVDFMFGTDADFVREAMKRFIRSFLVAVKTPNGCLLSHSIPSQRHIDGFDLSVLERVPTEKDLSSQGDVYKMVWGRYQNDEVMDYLKKEWGVRHFITGHQPAEMGYEIQGKSMIILASDHNHGVALPINLSKVYEFNELIDAIVPLASISVD